MNLHGVILTCLIVFICLQVSAEVIEGTNPTLPTVTNIPIEPVTPHGFDLRGDKNTECIARYMTCLMANMPPQRYNNEVISTWDIFENTWHFHTMCEINHSTCLFGKMSFAYTTADGYTCTIFV